MDVTTTTSASLKFGNLDFECFSKSQIPSNPVFFFSFLIACLRCVEVKEKKNRLAWGDCHFKQHGLH